VTPSGAISNVWDNHGGTGVLGGITGYAMLKAAYCIPPLDRGLSALLEDLHDRGMLDETLVVALGEMGRTPRINKMQGRDHWGAAQSALLAGGGIRGGQVYGATDKHAAFVKDNPVRPEDLLATVYNALGIDPDSQIHDRERRPYAITEGRPVTALFG
jgi:arylsulfatase A-like enzyme